MQVEFSHHISELLLVEDAVNQTAVMRPRSQTAMLQRKAFTLLMESMSYINRTGKKSFSLENYDPL